MEPASRIVAYGKFWNFDGYYDPTHDVRGWPWKWGPWHKVIYMWRLDAAAPLTYEAPSGEFVRGPMGPYETDGATVPPPFAGNYPPSEFFRSTCGYHDPAYSNGELYFSDRLDGIYVPRKVTRDYADQLLYIQAIAEGVQEGRPYAKVERRARLYWEAVQHWGRANWKKR